MTLIRRPSLATVLLALAPFGAACDKDLVEVPGDITGKVCGDDGEPLVGAAVVITGRTTREALTDGNGEYSASRVLPGSYDIVATLGDFTREFKGQVVAAQQTLVVTDIACRPDPNPGDTGSLEGQICNRHTGSLITDGRLVIPLADGTSIEGRTDGEGRFAVDGIPAGEHIVTIIGEGYQRAFAVTIVKDQVARLDLAEDCDGVNLGEGGVVGSFCDPQNGGNLVGATVTVSPLTEGLDEPAQSDLTDVAGQFEVNGLLPGRYAVNVNAIATANYVFDTEVDVIAGELASVTDEQSCGNRPEVGTVQGQICDADAGGVFVGAVDLLSGPALVDTTQTDAGGRFQFTNVVPGTYDVRFHRDGFERLFSGIVVTAFTAAFIEESDCPELEDVCSIFESDRDVISDGRILLVVDRSGSMGEDMPTNTGNQEKWTVMKNALINVTASLTSTVEFGLMMYPQRSVSDVCQEGGEVLALARNNANQIENQLQQSASNPFGGTPTASTLAEARDIVAEVLDADTEERPLAVVLATDGGPNCNESFNNGNPGFCTCTDPTAQLGNCASINCLDDQNSYAQVSAIKNLGVNVFVVGVLGAESFGNVLDEMAVRGGTALNNGAGQPKHYQAQNEAALQSALEEITQRIVACRVQSPTNLTQVDSITVSVGSQVVARDGARQNGWDVTGTNTIELFGSACDLAVASADNVVVETCVAP